MWFQFINSHKLIAIDGMGKDVVAVVGRQKSSDLCSKTENYEFYGGPGIFCLQNSHSSAW
jgi:hypothetical protein